MANRLIKTAELVYTPGVPVVIGRPAYCITHSEIIGWKKNAGFGSASSGASAPNIPPQVPYPTDWRAGPNGEPTPSAWGYSYPPGNYPSGGGGGGGGGGGKTPIYKHTKECFPAIIGVPGSPARVDSQASSGWGGGARSIATLPAGKQFELDIKKNPIAIIVGIAPTRTSYEYAALASGVVIRSGGIRSISNGVEGPNLPLQGTKLIVRRSPHFVEYFFAGQSVYRVPLLASQQMHVYALLYAMSDYVENPKFATPVEIQGGSELLIQTEIDRTPRGVSYFHIEAAGEMYQSGLSVFKITASGQPIAGAEIAGVRSESGATSYIWSGYDSDGNYTGGSIGEASYASSKMSIAGSSSDSDIARASGVFAKIELSARSSMAEQATIEAFGLFPVPQVYGWVNSGSVLNGDSDLSAAGKASDAPFLGGSVEVYLAPEIGGWFDEGAPGFIRSNEAADLADIMYLDSALLFAFSEGVDIGHGLDIYLVLSLAMQEAVLVDDGITLAALLELAMQERVNVVTRTDSNAAGFQADVLQYAVNAVTGALSRYENFGFSSFATAGGKTYAATRDGVYELTGGVDEGDCLTATIDFGAGDAGTAQLKRLSSVYMGVSTDGGVYVRVAGDWDEPRTYKATSYKQEARAITAKGLTARHWRIGLEITDATYADLDNYELEIGVSQRRLRSTR